MKSLSKLFRIGHGPSSSHTIAPYNAAHSFKKLLVDKEIDSIDVLLFGSLALTGVGHGTDSVLKQAFSPYPCNIHLDGKKKPRHPNEMTFIALKDGEKVLERTYDSLGGGELFSLDDESVNEVDIYPFRSFDQIKDFMLQKDLLSLKDFCLLFEDSSIQDYLREALDVMFECVQTGLLRKGKLPTNNNPRLQIYRKAGEIYKKACDIEDSATRRSMLITSYAYAVMEESASREKIVTAPTCGSSGILPAVLYYSYKNLGIDKERIVDSLYSAGVIGNIVKQNASISGAIGGCQAEVGTATSMASAALCALDNLSLYQLEYASECAMEHFLGLSCDPVDGYVVIPCIERNGVGALRAYDSYLYSKHIAPIGKNMVSFDNVVSAMKLTGDALASAYKETAEGGLAKILKEYEQ